MELYMCVNACTRGHKKSRFGKTWQCCHAIGPDEADGDAVGPRRLVCCLPRLYILHIEPYINPPYLHILRPRRYVCQLVASSRFCSLVCFVCIPFLKQTLSSTATMYPPPHRYGAAAKQQAAKLDDEASYRGRLHKLQRDLLTQSHEVEARMDKRIGDLSEEVERMGAFMADEFEKVGEFIYRYILCESC